jgi:hypothetical protein
VTRWRTRCSRTPAWQRVYDLFDDDRSDLTAYLGIADELRAQVVLDLGCGTGTFALLLAALNRTVIGVAPAAASLDVARAPCIPGATWCSRPETPPAGPGPGGTGTPPSGRRSRGQGSLSTGTT